MSLAVQPQGEVKKWRAMVLVIVGGLLALLALYAGVLGLLAGLGYLTATLVEARKSRQVTLSTTPEMGSTSS